MQKTVTFLRQWLKVCLEFFTTAAKPELLLLKLFSFATFCHAVTESTPQLHILSAFFTIVQSSLHLLQLALHAAHFSHMPHVRSTVTAAAFYFKTIYFRPNSLLLHFSLQYFSLLAYIKALRALRLNSSSCRYALLLARTRLQLPKVKMHTLTLSLFVCAFVRQ